MSTQFNHAILFEVESNVPYTEQRANQSSPTSQGLGSEAHGVFSQMINERYYEFL